MAPAMRGFADVVVAATAVSDIDRRAGRLSYRGYDVTDLAGRTSYEECAYLLHCGSLPTRRRLDDLRVALAAARPLPPLVDRLVRDLAPRSGPLQTLRTAVSALAHDDPDADATDPAADRRKAVRLVAAVPVLLARYATVCAGRPAPRPRADPALGVAATFLAEVTGGPPGAAAVAAFDECLLLLADHAMAAATLAARLCAASRSDMHSAVVAGIGALCGPPHTGGAASVLALLRALEGEGNVPAAVRRRFGADEPVPGFGHRTYRGPDPRSARLRPLALQLSASAPDSAARSLAETAAAVADAVLATRGLHPTADVFAVPVYAALGIPAELFPGVLAVARTAGWTAHVAEQHADNRLIRPDSAYVGERGRRWVPPAGRAGG